jgi:hypothetical protein
VENNTLNENASSDCDGKDAKTASFRMKSGFKQKWICEEVRSAKAEARELAADYASICCASRSRLKATRRSRATAAK